MARLIDRMNDVAFRPNAISSALRALTNAATLARARAIIASTSRECRYGPPRWTFRVRRWSVTASSTLDGICAPAALSKKTNRPACSSAGNRRRSSSTGNPRAEREAPPGTECEASTEKEREALAERSDMGFPARARVCEGDESEKWQEPHDTVLQPVDEERGCRNRHQRHDAEPRRRAMRGHPDRQPRELV